MSALTNYAENRALDYLLAGTVYVALHIGDPGEDGTVGEVTTAMDANYARHAATFTPAENGAAQNIEALSWTVDSGSAGYTVTHISIWDAAVGGNPLFKGGLLVPLQLTPRAVNNALASGAIIITLD